MTDDDGEQACASRPRKRRWHAKWRWVMTHHAMLDALLDATQGDTSADVA